MPGRSGRKKREELMGNEDEEEEIVHDEENDAPLTMQEKIENKREDIQDDLDDTKDMINEAKTVGAATNKKLAMQNEQLRKANDDLDDIDENMNQADHSLYRMEMCCLFSLCCCCCHNPAPKRKNNDMGVPKAQAGEVDKPKDLQPQRERLDENEEGIDDEERHERRVANKLDDISAGLDVLNDLAKEQNAHLKETKEINEKLGQKIDNQRGRVKASENRGKRLLR
mmetsp:Transcript_13126/g.18137  ORF Transcript_13126/g.18137 Transcript_13126/m.18137 type:complete len:226 (-) Transcript_13126:331-1008(-)|eukprot:CAMPEP_0184480712 /NCGR_PEP_ID=MMETSP0113_2-20130426/2225_1 /TAXON_ID=91329 /ORGANISM="Norrisiella sphaerica, Strain BC52" /LENGTH=225 /DNA_ID=CAMNT_0026859375 /DNA_START=58 /DNA_END=735 /DNA_ORIENTATION=-